ncbi:hypothetical protein L210DRAFT_3359413, partial [Boletus edulis BED1]
MVSAELLCQISERISQAKQACQGAAGKPFGGINIIYAGDLGQLRPVASSALYASNLLGRLAPSTKESIRGHRGLFGAALWQQLTHVIELKQNVRAITDPFYVDLLNRFRRLQLDAPTEYQTLCDAPVIFGSRRLRDLYNTIRARQFAEQTNQTYHFYLARD